MSRRLALVIFAVLAVYTLSGAPRWVYDTIFNPWAHANPPLLDEWAGSLRTGSGEPLAVVFSLQRVPDTGSECYGCATIEGRATTCDSHGMVRYYLVSGSPADRAGRQVRLGLTPERQPPPDGLEFSTVKGTWDGADSLTLEATFFWRRGQSAISSTDDPDTQPVPLRMIRRSPADRGLDPHAITSPCA